MSSYNTNYQLLIQKLDAFIRKYYINQLLRGSIYAGSILLAAFLLASVSEYFLYFSVTVRTILFWALIGGAAIILTRWVILPLIHYYKLGKIISHKQAAKIIGTHFTDVQDRLLNILQLREQMDTATDTSLIEASINQKAETLRPVPFTSAINLSVNRRYLKFLIPPALIFVFILFSAPNIIKDSAIRLLHHDTYFEKKAPFQFSVTNKNLTALQYQDFDLDVKVTGNLLPDEVFVRLDGYPYKLTKKSPTEFSYRFSKLQKSIDFRFEANGFESKEFHLEVLPKPLIVKFETEMNYPVYTGKKDETLNNIGDITVPQGTKVNWKFFAQNTKQVSVLFGGEMQNAPLVDKELFTFSQRMMKDKPYTIYVSGEKTNHADSINYSITVIPDMYPTISVSGMQDSVNRKYLYFAGEAGDDYGLKKLELKYKVTGEDERAEDKEFTVTPLAIEQQKQIKFTQFWDLGKLNLKPGDKVDYYFEVWDNDGVNGSKSSRTQTMSYLMPTVKEMEKQQSENNKDIKKDLESAIKDAKQLSKQFEEMQDNILQKKELSWEDKKKIQDLLDRQKEVQSKIENVQNKFNENIQQQQDLQKQSQDILDKQKQLQDLANQLLTPEMKEMMQKLQQMLDQLNKDKALDQLKDQKSNNDQLQKEMDRMLSLFKKLEMEQKFNSIKDKLDSLADKQDALSKEAEDKKNFDKSDELNKKQEEINKQFDDLKKELQELDKMNSELENPEDLPDTKQDQQDIDKDLQNSSDQLQKKNNSKAGQSQKSAAKKMKDMAKKMGDAMSAMQMQGMELDMQSLRQILKNLVKTSFDQEDLLNRSKQINIYNPKYLQLMKDQHTLGDNIAMIEDSIQALSKRVFQIKTYADKQISDINKNMDDGIKYLEQRQPRIAAANQQHIMTGLNNLALMFDEVLQQMQQEMDAKSGKPGSGMCNKPGGMGKKPNMSTLSQMQKQLNDKLNELGEKMKNGQKPGQKPGQQGQMSSQEAAQLAAQQSAIRDALRQLNEQLNKDGKGSLGNLEQLQKQMEETEKQLVNKQLTQETLKRQQDILTKLLEAEKSERERDQENKRQSTTGQDIVHTVPPSIEEYLKKKQAEIELYKTVPPSLKPFYKNLVEEYYKSINQ